MLTEGFTVGLSHLSVFPKFHYPSRPLGHTAVAQSLLYREEQSPKITSLLCTLCTGQAVEGQKQGLQGPGVVSHPGAKPPQCPLTSVGSSSLEMLTR